MNRWQDIAISDANLKAQFIAKFLNGDYEDAFEIIDENPQLDTKAFMANILNEIANLLSLLQNNFQHNIIDYLATQLDNFDDLINQFKLKQDWDSSVVYEKYNFVVYNNNDYMYIYQNPSSGVLPTDSEYWLKINITGEDGGDGVGVNLKYGWDSTVEYQALDVVYYDNALWVACYENINKIPSDESVWQTFTDNIISFNNDEDYSISKFMINIEPGQSGSGAPSPTNIRPISGKTGINIWREATYDTSASPILSVSWQQDIGTVYGGELDLNSGILKVIYAGIDLSSLTWEYSSSLNYNLISYTDIHAKPPIGRPDAICSCYQVYSYQDGVSAENAITIVNVRSPQTSTVRTSVWVRDLNYSDVNTFISDVSGQMLVYQLKTPLIYHLTPHQIQLLTGNNVIWTDTFLISITLEKKYWENFLTFNLTKIYSDMFPPINDDLYNGVIWIELIPDYAEITGRIVNFYIDEISPLKIEADLEPIQEGEGDPSPTNIKPINGHTGININITSKNIFNISEANFKNGYVLNSSGGETSNSAYRYTQNYIMVSPSTTYCGQAVKTTSNSSDFTACEYDENKVFIRRSTFYSSSSASSGLKSGSFTTSATTKYIRFSIGNGTTTDIMIAEGSEYSIYENFGSNDPIQFGLTVYGGKVIINNDGTGEVKSRPYYSNYNGETLVGPWVSSEDVYSVGATPTIGAQVVDMGGTETTVAQLSFASPINTLIGNNIIWVDDSNSITVIYINNL